MKTFIGTPGPWKLAGGQTDMIITDKPSGENQIVAATYGDNMPENARLIATAPELLAALQEMVAIVKKNTYPTPDKPSSTWGRVEMAEGIIAKALWVNP